jgi:lipid II:glycine glycyltransferase (peptidoglycan interpeptide bridge formation enzyme)
MVVYSLVGDQEIWNSEITRNTNFNPYQIYQWGEYKKQFGWNVISIKANNNGQIGYMQLTYKRKFKIFAGWCIGSISGEISAFKKESFINFIKQQFDVKYVMIKSSFTNILDFNDSIELYSANWQKSCKKLNSDYTIYIDLKKSEDELLTNCSTNFRKNVKRGIQNNLNIEIKKLTEYEENEIINLFDRFKEIKDVPLPDKNELLQIKKHLGVNVFVATSKIENQIVGLRAFLYHGNKALDFWATTDLIGRKNYTSFVLLFELFKKAKEINIESYDMSGIDPINNPTGFSFKNGLRAHVVEKLGEWEISNSKLLSFLVNKVYL